MGEVSEEQRQTLVEFIAHLCNKDWRAVVQALHKLGFIPDDAPDPDAAGVTKMLGAIMGQIVDGGGAGRISISTLMSEMEGLAASYPLRVPGYFALVLRAFGVLEGIALKADPEYSIVGECFPYLSRRLLSDNSEHSRVLLRKLLYTDGGRLDVRRVQRMAQGFRAYSMETKSGAGEEGARPRRCGAGVGLAAFGAEQPGLAPVPRRPAPHARVEPALAAAMTAPGFLSLFRVLFSPQAVAGDKRASPGPGREGRAVFSVLGRGVVRAGPLCGRGERRWAREALDSRISMTGLGCVLLGHDDPVDVSVRA